MVNSLDTLPGQGNIEIDEPTQPKPGQFQIGYGPAGKTGIALLW
jgi:hypothetical protein